MSNFNKRKPMNIMHIKECNICMQTNDSNYSINLLAESTHQLNNSNIKIPIE